jgi:hypothetical protein
MRLAQVVNIVDRASAKPRAISVVGTLEFENDPSV